MDKLHDDSFHVYDLLEKAKLWRLLKDQLLPWFRAEKGMNIRKCRGYLEP